MTLWLLRFALCCVATAAAAGKAFAQDSVIKIRLSYKVVLNPANGQRPPNVADADIDSAIDNMVDLMNTYWRGYRFQRVDPIIDVGGTGQSDDPSQWYDTDFFDENSGHDWKNQMEAMALNNPNAYAWNFNAINLYVTNGICGGKCSFAKDAEEIIIIGGCSDGNGPLHLHEIGHYYDLCHTQGCMCGMCDLLKTGECHTVPGDDNIADTLPDLECWNKDDIAMNAFGMNYASLMPAQQEEVDDVFFNIMSYHSVRSRLTELQLDVWTDRSNGRRIGVADGRTWFVQVGGSDTPDGSSMNPFGSVGNALNALSSANDIILLKPGSYNEMLVLQDPITLRATRQGAVTIGR